MMHDTYLIHSTMERPAWVGLSFNNNLPHPSSALQFVFLILFVACRSALLGSYTKYSLYSSLMAVLIITITTCYMLGCLLLFLHSPYVYCSEQYICGGRYLPLSSAIISYLAYCSLLFFASTAERVFCFWIYPTNFMTCSCSSSLFTLAYWLAIVFSSITLRVSSEDWYVRPAKGNVDRVERTQEAVQ